MLDYFSNAIELSQMFIDETLATLYMVSVTAFIAGGAGIVIGVFLAVSESRGILENAIIHNTLDKIVNVGRSIPFIIMLAIIAPVTRAVVGTTIGNTAAIVPLVVGTAPFFARQVQNALAEVDRGVIEAAQAMGLTPYQIVKNVYLSEAKEGLIRAGAVTVISLIGLTAMAGAIGAGGLGKMAISYGYNKFNDDVTIVATALILLLVFLVQAMANVVIKLLKH